MRTQHQMIDSSEDPMPQVLLEQGVPLLERSIHVRCLANTCADKILELNLRP